MIIPVDNSNTRSKPLLYTILMHSVSMKQKAIDLRQYGHSYTYIASHTGLSKSTLSGWLAEIPYIPNEETRKRIGKARAASREKKSALKRLSILEAKNQAKKEIREITARDLFFFGLGLYL